MKHYYLYCPDNLDGQTEGHAKEIRCTWCLHELIRWFEYYYQVNPEPESAIRHLNKSLG